jgi:hypothetical protein
MLINAVCNFFADRMISTVPKAILNGCKRQKTTPSVPQVHTASTSAPCSDG